MFVLKNACYLGSENRSSLIDLTIPDQFSGEIIIFIHGFMGFKDWGAWSLMEDFFVSRGYGFCKFNLSHNGGTTEQPMDFPDEEAFGRNTYSNEKEDVRLALNWIENQMDISPNFHLLGHSRGGGIALLNALDERVVSVTTLAAISSISKRFEDDVMIQKWRKEGIRFSENQRTKQKLPHYVSMLDDFLENRDNLNIEAVCRQLQKPVCVIHGDADSSVSISEGEDLSRWLSVPLHRISGADHVFGASHPWIKADLPPDLAQALEIMVVFLGEQKKQ